MSEINPFEVDEPLIKKRSILEQSKSEDFYQRKEDAIVHDEVSESPSYLRFFYLEEGNYSWRRLIARMIDFQLLLLFVVTVLLISPVAIPIPLELIYYTCLSAIFIAIFEAFFIAYFSCTPGKWLCCIKIKDAKGNSPSLGVAFKRSFLVLAAGCGFYLLPIISIVCFAKSANDIKKKGITYWDNSCLTKVEVSKLGFFRITIISVLILLFLWIRLLTYFTRY